MKGFTVDHLNATVHEDTFLHGLKLKKIQDRIP